jgi:CheY-like chemotaxis protein
MKGLVIDDEPDIRMIARLAFERFGGWEFCEASGGEEGVVVACRERPDFIVVDVMMEGMDGPATFAALQKSDAAGIPVIFLTATTDPAEIARLRATGVRGVLSKPFSPRALPGQILALLGAPAAE